LRSSPFIPQATSAKTLSDGAAFDFDVAFRPRLWGNRIVELGRRFLRSRRSAFYATLELVRAQSCPGLLWNHSLGSVRALTLICNLQPCIGFRWRVQPQLPDFGGWIGRRTA